MSKPIQLHRNGGQQQKESQYHQHNQYLPKPLEPHLVRNFGNAYGTDKHSGGRRYHVGNSVAKLIRHYGNLARKPDNIRKRSHDGHCERCFGRARRNENIDDGLHQKH